MFLLCDVGGTNTRIALSKNLKDIDEIFVFETKEKYKDFLKVIEKFKERKIIKSCFGFAGNFDKNREKLIYAPNLKDYEGRNLKKDLEKILKCKVILENDAVLAGLGEAYFGAGKKYKIFSYLTFSSGIGGAKIVNHKVDENVFGFEPGHSLFLLNFFLEPQTHANLKRTNTKKTRTHTNLKRTYSNMYEPIRAKFARVRSKFEIVRIFRESSFPVRESSYSIEDLLGGKSLEEVFKQKLEEIKDKKFWREITKLYALFLINVSLFWSTEVIIIGGGISKRLDFKVLNKDFRGFHPLGWRVKILRSKLGDLGGIYGGLTRIYIDSNMIFQKWKTKK
jgi:predicted NBD/HSP70 family sugar kinase